MKKVSIGLLLCLGVFLTACAEEEQPAMSSDPGGITGASQTRETYQFAESGSNFTLGILVLEYNGENAAAAAINDELARMSQEYLTQTKAIDASYLEQDDTLIFNHELKYELVYWGDEIVSIRALGYDNNQLAPHPNSYHLGYVFSSQTGGRLGLEDILGEDYSTVLTEAIISDIKAADEQDNYYPGFEGQLPALLSEENWYIKDDLIYLIFNPYQISPAALGVLEFTYPYPN